MFAPSARVGDGIFDITVLQHGPIHQLLGMTFTIYKGEHLSSPLVKTFGGTHIFAETLTPDPAWLDLDGEAPGILPLTVEMLPQALFLLDARKEVQ